MWLSKSRTLKNQLTETVALWGIGFFLLLGSGFYVFFHDIESFLVGREAEQQLDVQAAGLVSMLNARELAGLTSELQAYTHASGVAAVVMFESDSVRHIATAPELSFLADAVGPHAYLRLLDVVANDPSMHVYTRKLYGYPYTLAVVMDSSVMAESLTMATEFTLVLLMVLLLISIKALHYVLGRRLIHPVDKLRSAMESSPPEDFAASMPQEITQALGMYEQLQQSHNVMKMQFLKLMDALPGCFWWSDDGRVYAGVSDKAGSLLLKSAHDLKAAPLWAWMPSEAQRRVNQQRLQQAIAKGLSSIDFAYQVHQKEGMCWYGETVTMVYDRDGGLEAVYGIMNDISSRKERQRQQSEKLELAQRMKATVTLVSGVAHEFNNALAGMTGNLFLIKEHPDDAMTAVRVGRIESLIEQAAGMIDQMLAFSLQSNLNPSNIDLAEFVRHFESSVLQVLPAGTRFDVKLGALQSGTGFIYADGEKLQEALMQLYDNAIAATSDTEHACISLTLTSYKADLDFSRRFRNLASRELLHLQFSDNGCGMPEDVRIHAFEPFFTTREVGAGTGLGLPMVYGYVRQLGGCVDVDSDPGKGTTIHLYLPMIEAEVDEERHNITLGHKETVLVIDDEKIFRDSCCEVLSELGYLPLSASSGEQGMRVFRQHQDVIQLVICDIVMPGIDGVQVFQRIRQCNSEIPFLFITAYEQTCPHVPELYASGCEVLDKPFNIPALSQAIERAMRPQQANAVLAGSG